MGRTSILLCFCLNLALQAFAAPKEAAGIRAVHWEPDILVNGSPVLFRVTTDKKFSSLSGTWLQHEFAFSMEPKSNLKTPAWDALAGVSIETPTGVYTLTLTGIAASGTKVVFQQEISVGKAMYRVIEISVPKQYTEPSAQQLQDIATAKKIKEAAFSKVTPERAWAGNFSPPVEVPTSDGFGTQRTINGKAQSTHQGLDFAAPTGTPVAAINRGTVILAQPLYFEGNCVVIDHGQGLLSLYLHLSKFEVKEGDEVARGQVLGLSGGTGRATGPHLHLAIRWQGVYLDPALLLKLNLP